jgi:hypothetical protein
MKSAPIIDLSLATPRQMILEKGTAIGAFNVIWFRLLRPSLVGTVWAAICVYTYRYLLPFDPTEMPVEQMFFYLSGILGIASAIVLWLVASHVAGHFAHRSKMMKVLHRPTVLSTMSGPFVMAAQARDELSPRILIASHDANGAITKIIPAVMVPHPQIALYASQRNTLVGASPYLQKQAHWRV